VYAYAPKDGTVIAAINQGAALFQQLGGKGAQYDAAKFNWVGRLGSSNNTIYTWSATGVRSIEDAKTRDVSMAGSGLISDADIYPKVLNALIGTRFKIINGYDGTNESNLAIERREVDGRGGGAYSSLVTTRPQWLRDRTISVLVQVGVNKEPDLPAVPRLLDLVTGDEDKQIAKLVTVPVEIGYNYWLAPEVPAERVALLRKAFDEAAHDPDLLAEAKSEGIDVRYKSGKELQDLVGDSMNTPKSILQRTVNILGW
jgi:tripartite-type tricarboxylate transporter receptor subunit TctC